MESALLFFLGSALWFTSWTIAIKGIDMLSTNHLKGTIFIHIGIIILVTGTLILRSLFQTCT